MKILEYPLTSAFNIILFEGRINDKYAIKNGFVVNGKYSESDLMSKSFRNHTIFQIQNLDELNKMYADAGIPDEEIHQQFIKIKAAGWDIPLDRTWVIVPKIYKEHTGKKLTLEFELINPQFSGYGNYELDVYMSNITKKSKSLKFIVNIPKYIYDKCMEHPEKLERPQTAYIEADTISTLHTRMGQLCLKSKEIVIKEKMAKKATKVLCINVQSSYVATKDNYQFADTGEETKIRFNYYVAYNTPENQLFSYKRFNEEEKTNRFYIHTKPDIIVEWTQEREDFLFKVQGAFRKLSQELHNFLGGMNNDNIDNLIANSNQFKLLPK